VRDLVLTVPAAQLSEALHRGDRRAVDYFGPAPHGLVHTTAEPAGTRGLWLVQLRYRAQLTTTAPDHQLKFRLSGVQAQRLHHRALGYAMEYFERDTRWDWTLVDSNAQMVDTGDAGEPARVEISFTFLAVGP
jgi:hypothetical protein